MINSIIVFIIVHSLFIQANSQVPALNFHNYINKEVRVIKSTKMSVSGTFDSEAYSYIITDSIIYVAGFDSIYQVNDSTFGINYLIKNLKKVSYFNNEILEIDSLESYKVKYFVNRNGSYIDVFLEPRIAAIERYLPVDSTFKYDPDLNDRNPLSKNNILLTLYMANQYWELDEIKFKILQELYWIHLFPSLRPLDEIIWSSSQPVYLDLNLDRMPSRLSLVKEGNLVQIQQEVDQISLYKGMVSDEELKIIENTDPSDFFFRISSKSTYEWDFEKNIPRSIKAIMTTSVNGTNQQRVDTYDIEFVD